MTYYFVFSFNMANNLLQLSFALCKFLFIIMGSLCTRYLLRMLIPFNEFSFKCIKFIFVFIEA